MMHASRPVRRRSNRRSGVVLLLVLVIISMLALAAFGFSNLMLNERRAAQAASQQAQVRSLARSGAQLARQFLDLNQADQLTAGGVYDNSSRFADQIVIASSSPRDQGRFSVVAPKITDTTVDGVRYGLQDECTRINLTTILNFENPKVPLLQTVASSASTSSGTSNAENMLVALPGMTLDVAQSILDWIDSDDNPRDQGAESDYYSSLPNGYNTRNGPPTSIEELLLVKGVTPELLFGLDAAKMGYSPTGGSSSGGSSGGSIGGVSDGSMDHGWAAYLTLWSAESNLKADGTPKININQQDLNGLYNSIATAIDAPTAAFIVSVRIGHEPVDASGNFDVAALSASSTTAASSSGSSSGGSTPTLTGKNTIGSFLDLVGLQVQKASTSTSSQGGQSGGGGGGGTGGSTISASSGTLQNPFTSDTASMGTWLPKLFDNCTVYSGPTIPGRININLAPRAVLMCIPGMTQDLCDQIIANRNPDPNTQPADQAYPTWPLIEGYVDLPTMKQLLPYITSGGNVFRAQVIGKFDKEGPTARVEAVIDATNHPAQILFWKDISQMNGTFPAEPTAADTAANR